MALLELYAGCGRIGRRPDQGNDWIELVEGQQQAQQDVVPFLCFAQEVAGATLNGLDPEVEEHPQHLAEGEQHGLAIHQRQHVGTEIIL